MFVGRHISHHLAICLKSKTKQRHRQHARIAHHHKTSHLCPKLKVFFAISKDIYRRGFIICQTNHTRGEAKCRGRQQEHHEVPSIPSTNTRTHKRTVMIVHLNANVASATVERPWWPYNLACIAV